MNDRKLNVLTRYFSETLSEFGKVESATTRPRRLLQGMGTTTFFSAVLFAILLQGLLDDASLWSRHEGGRVFAMQPFLMSAFALIAIWSALFTNTSGKFGSSPPHLAALPISAEESGIARMRAQMKSLAIFTFGLTLSTALCLAAQNTFEYPVGKLALPALFVVPAGGLVVAAFSSAGVALEMKRARGSYRGAATALPILLTILGVLAWIEVASFRAWMADDTYALLIPPLSFAAPFYLTQGVVSASVIAGTLISIALTVWVLLVRSRISGSWLGQAHARVASQHLHVRAKPEAKTLRTPDIPASVSPGAQRAGWPLAKRMDRELDALLTRMTTYAILVSLMLIVSASARDQEGTSIIFFVPLFALFIAGFMDATATTRASKTSKSNVASLIAALPGRPERQLWRGVFIARARFALPIVAATSAIFALCASGDALISALIFVSLLCMWIVGWCLALCPNPAAPYSLAAGAQVKASGSFIAYTAIPLLFFLPWAIFSWNDWTTSNPAYYYFATSLPCALISFAWLWRYTSLARAAPSSRPEA